MFQVDVHVFVYYQPAIKYLQSY